MDQRRCHRPNALSDTALSGTHTGMFLLSEATGCYILVYTPSKSMQLSYESFLCLRHGETGKARGRQVSLAAYTKRYFSVGRT